MSFGFGELNFDSSAALADDEEEAADDNQPGFVANVMISIFICILCCRLADVTCCLIWLIDWSGSGRMRGRKSSSFSPAAFRFSSALSMERWPLVRPSTQSKVPASLFIERGLHCGVTFNTLGLGEGLVKAGKLDLVARVFLRGNEAPTLDLCSLRRSPKLVARLYASQSTLQPLLFQRPSLPP
jgi:hypothetical protein